MISIDELSGSWQLESWTMGYSDRDDITSPYGEDPRGLLLYSADGWMSVSICRRERDLLPAHVSFRKLPDRDKSGAFSTYFHYAGRYRVVAGDIIHYISHSLNPNFSGTEQLRHAELDGQTLVLAGKEQAGAVSRLHTLVWHRIQPSEEYLVIESEQLESRQIDSE